MIKIQCNRCGKEIDINLGVGFIHFGCMNPFDSIPPFDIDNSVSNRAHYCEDCMSEIWNFMQNRPEESASEVERTENEIDDAMKAVRDSRKQLTEIHNSEAEDPKKQQHIDIGKIMALKNAGWSVAKIADEMGMQPQAVSNAIYQQKKRMEASKVV